MDSTNVRIDTDLHDYNAAGQVANRQNEVDKTRLDPNSFGVDYVEREAGKQS